MLTLISFASFAGDNDKDCKKKGKACTEAEMKKCKEDPKCAEACKDGKADAKACSYTTEAAKADAGKKSCCKK